MTKIITELHQKHAHLQTMTKAPVKFKKDQPRTVGGAANTVCFIVSEHKR